MEYNINKPWLSLEPWQVDVIGAKGNVVVRSGRQAGKSTAISIKAGDYAMKNPKKEVLIIAAVERQAFLLFDKVLNYILGVDKYFIKKGKDRPTKSRIKLTNGSVIRCLPTGLSGMGIRGFTIDLLIADEAAFIPEEVWTAVTPMLAITKGKIILLSTPFGRQGYFYRAYTDPNFQTFHVSAEDCPRKDDKFLAQEKERMTELQYAQEYLGEFVDELRQFFPSDLIRKTMTLTKRPIFMQRWTYYLGIDVAGMGKDASTFEIIGVPNKSNLYHMENVVTKKTRITDTVHTVLELEKKYNFKRIFIDDGGMGVGVFDQLLTEPTTRRKIEAINNSSRPIDKDKRRKKLLKEDLYNNLLRLMERKEIKLLDDEEIYFSMASVQYEYKDGKLYIFGNDTHICEGLIRAVYGVRTKNLNIYRY